MRRSDKRTERRGTVLLMIVGLLAMLFIVVTAYISLARFDRLTVQQVAQADRVDEVSDSIDKLLTAEIQGRWGAELGALVTGSNYVETPGSPQSPWLSSPEPVADPNEYYDDLLPKDYKYPAVTSLAGSAREKRLIDLMVDSDAPTDVDPLEAVYVANPEKYPSVTILPHEAQPGDDEWADTSGNARRPLTDADGDGIADSCAGTPSSGVFLLTKQANAVAGSAVPDGNFDLTRLYDPPPSDWSAESQANWDAWERFDEQARYLVAARVISHGGMVQLGSPLLPADTWNYGFVRALFNWVQLPNTGDLNDLAEEDWEDLAAARAAVEPHLRSRGGLLVNRQIAERGVEGGWSMPSALWSLTDTFPRTLLPAYEADEKADIWQRFNLASQELREWDAWRKAITVDPVVLNSMAYEGGFSGFDPREWYVKRQVLTTVNYSDELARIQAPWDALLPEDRVPNPDSLYDIPGLYPGQLKFYLGRIADPDVGAFDTDGNFLGDPDGVIDAGERGALIVRELADYFHEMLMGYRGWDDDPDPAGPDQTESISRREQALMLAVNTVAFAAPRNSSHYIDAVYYIDPLTGQRYIGYVPQPFITQVVAYNDPDEDTGRARIALAVELYNPHDSEVGGGSEFDLDLDRFGISIDDGDIVRLSTLGELPWSRMPGRSFLLFAVHTMGGNSFFETEAAAGTYLGANWGGTISSSVSFSSEIAVKLWRRSDSLGAGGAWHMVDELAFNTGKYSAIGGSWTSFDRDEKWYVNRERDTRSEPYFGHSGTPGRAARWRMTVSIPADEADTTDVHDADLLSDTQDPPGLMYLGHPIDDTDGRAPFGPTVPLYMMNAGLGVGGGLSPPIHGVQRPASFPTVGFMAFIPRYSHMMPAAGSVGGDVKPITQIHYEQMEERGLSAASAPADFGHMPLFDNNQAIDPADAGEDEGDGGFDVAGKVPWGQLVFDYFTTIDPLGPDLTADTEDDIDPYRVPGRININTATWYVLAGLPVIGPDTGTSVMPYGTADMSPAFWSPESGILVGEGEEFGGAKPRFPELVVTRDEPFVLADGEFYRLGPRLAQAMAAYRDGVQHVADSILGEAHTRPGYRDPVDGSSVRYGAIREASKPGFLTLGELANVMGFDGTSLADFADESLGVEVYERTVLGRGDFMKAASLLALLDTHFLTTRSNTFTIYTTVTDRESPQASVRSQVTLDRSNMLPRLVVKPHPDYPDPGERDILIPMLQQVDLDDDGSADSWGPIIVEGNSSPQIISRREASYYNSQHAE